MGRIKGGKTAALMCGILFCFVVSFPVFFIAAEADHQCTGADCPVCAVMRVCVSLLHSAGLSGAAGTALSALPVFFAFLLCWYDAGADPLTLVSLKVKLSN